MTAIEMIYKAQDINKNSTMLEIASAKRDLNMLGDIVAGGKLEVAYKIAMYRVHQAEKSQNIMAQNGKLLRII